MKLLLLSLALVPFGPAAWRRPAPPVHIVGNTWEVGSEGLSIFLIRTRAGVILIDTGPPGYAPALLQTLGQLGYRSADVKWLLNTHAHLDHAGSLTKMKMITGAKVAAMAQDVPALSRGNLPGSETRHEFDFEPVHVDRVLNDGDVVSLGGTTLVAHLTPGHTAGCTTWTWTEHEAGQTLRVLLDCSTSVSVNRLHDPAQYPGIVADYRRTFARLHAMSADVYLAPHAEMYDLTAKRARLAKGSRNPFIDPSELQRAVTASEKDFEKALTTPQPSASPAEIKSKR